MYKKLLALALSLCLLSGLLGGCAKKEEKTVVTVFAAASLTEVLTTLGDTYMQAHEDVTLVFNFDSSGTLQTQIEEGAVCDLFLSAAPTQMNALDDAGLVASRVDLLENRVALVVPADNPAGITSYDDLAAHLEAGDILMAMGGADVPVGQYTQKIFAYFGLDEAALTDAGCLTYGSNVKEVASQVSEGAVDCGVVYQTDAAAAGLLVVDVATGEMCGQVLYPAGVLAGSKQADAAQDFLAYLQTDAAGAVFTDAGFTPLEG